jgi:SCP-2 sterol transfer family protein
VTAEAQQGAFFGTAELARLVGSTPDEQLAAGLRTNGESIVGEVFRRFPERLSPEGRRQRAAIEWRLRGIGAPSGADAVQRWFVVLEDGECRTGRDLDIRPRVTFELAALDFLKLVTGNANPLKLALTGKLKVRGDLLFAPRVQRFFEVPRG